MTACTAQPAPDLPPPASASGEVPEFDGPWAADFATLYASASSDFERDALRDGQITDQEVAEARSRFGDCLAGFGITGTSFEPNGAFRFDTPEGRDADAVNELVQTCSHDSGEAGIGALHSWIRRNPENLDDDTIIAACLVRKGAVDPSYSGQDFAADEEDLSIPYLTGFGEATFVECNADPLGRFE